jgi:hypothetical protein
LQPASVGVADFEKRQPLGQLFDFRGMRAGVVYVE